MKKFILAALAASPALAFAAPLDNIGVLMKQIGNLVDLALPIVVGVALLGFFWGLAKFIFAAGDEEKRKEARSIMIYGVIALFVMVSVWGLVGFLGQTVGITPGQTSGTIPSVTGL
jgi:hypothetical protein